MGKPPNHHFWIFDFEKWWHDLPAKTTTSPLFYYFCGFYFY